MSTEIETLVRRFYAELWEAGREDAAQDILHRELTFRGSLGSVKSGIEGYLSYLRMVRGALAGYRCDILSLMCQGSQAAARMRFHGVHSGLFMGVEPTGRHIAWAGAAFFEMRERRLADIWVLGDVDGLRAELAGAGSETA